MTAPAVTSAFRLCQHTSRGLPPDSRTDTTTRSKGKAATRVLSIRSRFLHSAQPQPTRFVQEIATLSSSYILLSYSQKLPLATNRAHPSNTPEPSRLRLDLRNSSYKQLPPSLLQPHTTNSKRNKQHHVRPRAPLLRHARRVPRGRPDHATAARQQAFTKVRY